MAALFFIGIGYLAITPPYEGFDENAHLASMRQVADTGTIPLYGQSFIPKDITDYYGPVAYGSLTPPFDSGMTYVKFFAAPERVQAYLRNERTPRVQAAGFTPSTVANWQAQHPFLYYALMAPLVKATEHLSFVMQMFILRCASYIMALAGVLLGFLAARRSPEAQLGFLLYPIIFPMFFPEFARLGNDALCLLFSGVSAYCLNQHLENTQRKRWALALGLSLGLGLLSKAFFIPITVAICGFLLLHNARQDISMPKVRIGLVAALALFVGSGWYLYKVLVHGDLIGGHDAILLEQKGGLAVNILKNFTLSDFMRSLTATFTSWSWSGTWSLVRPHPLLHIPILVYTAFLIVTYLLQLKKYKMAEPAWLPFWLLVVFTAGLLHHILIGLATNGNGNTPGYYLHILMPWMALALGLAARPLWKEAQTKIFFAVATLYAAIFHAIVLWSQFALYTGCAAKGDDKIYRFSGSLFCLDQTPLLIERLGIIGWPVLALCGFVCGLLFTGLVIRSMLVPDSKGKKNFKF